MTQGQEERSTGTTFAGRYELIDRLRRDALGVTYLAREANGGATRHLLLIDDDLKVDAAALAKAVTLSQKHSAGQLPILAFGYDEGLAWVAFEVFAGDTLALLLRERKAQGEPFHVREVAQIINGLLASAKATADAGHIIRALRPETVLVHARRTGPGGRNVVYDVRVPGLFLWDLVPTGQLTAFEFDAGEAQYLAPELKSITPSLTTQADFFSIGVLFYEMLVGTPPLGTFQLPRKRRPDLPRVADTVAQAALSPAPEDRYRSARDFQSGLEALFEDKAEVAAPPPAPNYVRYALVGVSVLATLLGGVIVFQSKDRDPSAKFASRDTETRNAVVAAYTGFDPGQFAAQRDANPNMVAIPAGPVLVGRLNAERGFPSEPVLEKRETGAFLIDVFEWPNEKGAPPESGLNAAQAAERCATKGKRLCSADELEKACKGGESRVYPYGDAFDAATCGEGAGAVGKAGDRSDCRSGWGVFDLGGNLREWTSSEAAGGSRRVVAGGPSGAAAKNTRCAIRVDENASFAGADIGFRCCKDL